MRPVSGVASEHELQDRLNEYDTIEYEHDPYGSLTPFLEYMSRGVADLYGRDGQVPGYPIAYTEPPHDREVVR